MDEIKGIIYPTLKRDECSLSVEINHETDPTQHKKNDVPPPKMTEAQGNGEN